MRNLGAKYRRKARQETGSKSLTKFAVVNDLADEILDFKKHFTGQFGDIETVNRQNNHGHRNTGKGKYDNEINDSKVSSGQDWIDAETFDRLLKETEDFRLTINDLHTLKVPKNKVEFVTADDLISLKQELNDYRNRLKNYLQKLASLEKSIPELSPNSDKEYKRVKFNAKIQDDALQRVGGQLDRQLSRVKEFTKTVKIHEFKISRSMTKFNAAKISLEDELIDNGSQAFYQTLSQPEKVLDLTKSTVKKFLIQKGDLAAEVVKLSGLVKEISADANRNEVNGKRIAYQTDILEKMVEEADRAVISIGNYLPKVEGQQEVLRFIARNKPNGWRPASELNDLDLESKSKFSKFTSYEQFDLEISKLELVEESVKQHINFSSKLENFLQKQPKENVQFLETTQRGIDEELLMLRQLDLKVKGILLDARLARADLTTPSPEKFDQRLSTVLTPSLSPLDYENFPSTSTDSLIPENNGNNKQSRIEGDSQETRDGLDILSSRTAQAGALNKVPCGPTFLQKLDLDLDCNANFESASLGISVHSLFVWVPLLALILAILALLGVRVYQRKVRDAHGKNYEASEFDDRTIRDIEDLDLSQIANQEVYQTTLRKKQSNDYKLYMGESFKN